MASERSARLTWRLLVLTACASLAASGAARGLSEEEEYGRAWALVQSHRYVEAVAAYKKFLTRHPKGRLLAEAHFTLARVDASGNNAFSNYQYIVDNCAAHPLASQASYAVAQYYLNIGTLAEATGRFLDTYRRYGQSQAGSESLYRLALLALDSDSLEKARSYAETFVQQYAGNPRGGNLFSQLADCSIMKGDTTAAISDWKRIVALYPGSPEAGDAMESIAAETDEVEPESTAAAEPLVPAEPPAAPAAMPANPPPRSHDTHFYVQIGAYRFRETMDTWRRKLANLGYPAVVDSIAEKSGWIYKLQAGPYPSRPEAQQRHVELQDKMGIAGIVIGR